MLLELVCLVGSNSGQWKDLASFLYYHESLPPPQVYPTRWPGCTLWQELVPKERYQLHPKRGDPVPVPQLAGLKASIVD